jgi:hypothetical protein
VEEEEEECCCGEAGDDGFRVAVGVVEPGPKSRWRIACHSLGWAILFSAEEVEEEEEEAEEEEEVAVQEDEDRSRATLLPSRNNMRQSSSSSDKRSRHSRKLRDIGSMIRLDF